MPFEEIIWSLEDRVATITLNRPEKLNAATSTMNQEIVEAFTRADEDDDVRVVIVTGAGRAFCAGADLSRGTGAFSYDEDPSAHRDGGGLVTLKIFDCRKPVIAAINGPAVGFGLTMTLAMDIRLASEDARFGFVFARRGIVPEACSTWFLPRIVGIAQATEWIYTGRIFDAREALAGGLVKSVCPRSELLPAAQAIAREIADNTSAISVALCRQMLWKLLGADHPMAAHRLDSLGVATLGKLADAQEGVQSFLEKRPPRFTMRPSVDMPSYYPWWTERTFK